MQEARHQRRRVVGFRFQAMSRTGQSRETASRLAVTWSCVGVDGKWTATTGYVVSFWGDENVPEFDGGDGCTTQ